MDICIVKLFFSYISYLKPPPLGQVTVCVIGLVRGIRSYAEFFNAYLLSLNCNNPMSLWPIYRQDIGAVNVLIVTG